MNKQAGLGIQNWDFQQTDNGDVTNNQENQWKGKKVQSKPPINKRDLTKTNECSTTFGGFLK